MAWGEPGVRRTEHTCCHVFVSHTCTMLLHPAAGQRPCLMNIERERERERERESERERIEGREGRREGVCVSV